MRAMLVFAPALAGAWQLFALRRDSHMVERLPYAGMLVAEIMSFDEALESRQCSKNAKQDYHDLLDSRPMTN